MQNYRIIMRGNQHYVMPKVGKTWTQTERVAIQQALAVEGYFVSFVSDCRLAVSETSVSPKVADAEIYLERAYVEKF